MWGAVGGCVGRIAVMALGVICDNRAMPRLAQPHQGIYRRALHVSEISDEVLLAYDLAAFLGQ